jgi:signal transduction histidine kinase
MIRSIRTRLIISFIALALTPLLFLGIGFVLQSFTVLQNFAVDAQRQEATDISLQASTLLNDSIQRMQMLIQVDGVGNLDPAQQRILVDELMSYDHGINDLSVLDTAGHERVRVTRRQVLGQADLRDQSQSTEFKQATQNNSIYFSTVQIDQATSEPLMTVAIPTFDLRTGALNGVLVGAIRFRPVWDLISKLSGSDSDTYYIVDGTGRVIAHRDPSVILKSTTFKVPAQSGPSVGLVGDDVVLGRTDFQLGAQVFTVVAEKPTQEALSLATNLRFLTLLAILLALIGATVVGIVTVQRLVGPIVSLSNTAEAISAGDLTQRASVRGNDEISTLGKAFNSMTSRLAETLDGLRNNIANLEQATQERERLIVELQDASRLKSEFLSTMSHELRTPLNAMLGFSGLLLAGIGGSMDTEAQHMVERIESNSKRLLALINDILDISKIEAGQMDLVETPVSIRQMANQWETQLGVLAKKKGLTFDVRVDPSLPETVLVDRDKFTQIATNLLSNAIKFTEKGTVTLTAKAYENKLVVEVMDTGIGIPPHALGFIFDEFRQVDGSTRRSYGGTGLGLAIARKLCRLMNGNLTVSSVLDQGSTFTILVPLKIPNPVPAAAIQQASTQPLADLK